MKASQLVKKLEEKIEDFGDADVRDIQGDMLFGCYAGNKKACGIYLSTGLKHGDTPEAIIVF